MNSQRFCPGLSVWLKEHVRNRVKDSWSGGLLDRF
jgi:hypothetical protein